MTLALLHKLALAVGLIAYGALLVFCVSTLVRKITGKALLSAAVLTLLYLVALALTGESLLSLALSFAMLWSWVLLVCRGVGIDGANFRLPAMRPVAVLLGASTALFAAGLLEALWLLPAASASGEASWAAAYAMELLLAVCGLVALEQLVRNARDDLRWRLRYLNIGLGIVFIFSMLHSALALLYGRPLEVLSSLQPALLALAAPLVAIASLRNRDNQLRLNLSREFAFRTGVLVSAGTLLLLFGLAGYYAELFGGDVATALVVLLATILAVGGFVVFGSTSVRARLRRFVAQNLYARKHDYRSVWARISSQLTEPSADFTLPQQGIRSILGVLEAPGGALWRLSETQTLVPHARMHTGWDQPLSPRLSAALCVFFAEREWIVDLENPPDELPGAVCVELADALPGARFLVPLCVQGDLFGVVATTAPPLPTTLTWDDYDVLRLVSRQTAGLLALEHAGRMLSDTQQLNTFNRLSAFVVHDLKTVSAQLKLMLENAKRHKGNPAFIDDMLATVGNATQRMDRMLEQFRSQSPSVAGKLELGGVVAESLAKFATRRPQPELAKPSDCVWVSADPANLGSVIGHMVENAIEATPASGFVRVAVGGDDDWAEVSVEDNGCGMPSDFVNRKLFAPFESTKGVTGMGIGAYQTREYIRSLGGDVEVHSEPSRGTRFVLRIPRQEAS